MDYLKNKGHIFKNFIIIPLVSSLIIPLVIFDFWVEVYHRICFPLYNIPFVIRSQYIKIDRHKLTYLNLIQKIYCIYCGYGNGAINYWREIAARTEKYWCGIKHKKSPNFKEPFHHNQLNFAEYNNKEDFKKKYSKKSTNI